MAFQIFGSTQIRKITNIISKIMKNHGCCKAVHKPKTTARSSVRDAAIFENGSGDVLIRTRVPALAA